MERLKNIPNNKFFIGFVILLLGFFLGFLLSPSSSPEASAHKHIKSSENHSWTCSMHPSVRQNEPGDCPICGMDLIPVSEDEGEMDSDKFVMSDNALKLANVQTMQVGRSGASKEIRLSGKVEVDERNTYTQSTHIPGRIEQLRVNFTGEKVNRGQVLASIYSPALVTAQEELLQAAAIKESQPELFEAAKQKLRNWKISDGQIENILNNNAAIERFPITADVGGVVTELMAEQGDYLERGMPIYEIANLDKLWVLFDLYESTMGAVKEGSKVKYSIKSIPGQTFEGEVDFIDPLLNNNTRVATARVEIDNQDRRIKPGMFATGIIESNLDAQNKEIVIPKSAILWTGKRSLVYIKETMNERSGFSIREVVLGNSLGDSYIVEEGLNEADEIVVNGAFTVDAAVQLAGKPSMMSPSETFENSKEAEIEVSEDEKQALNNVFDKYFELKDALVEDDFKNASGTLEALENSLATIDNSKFENSAADAFKNYKRELQMHLSDLKASEDISAFRDGFDEFSAVIIRMAKSFKPFDERVYIQHCPMANNDKGANWLSFSEEIRNPYYGSAMLNCGEVTDTIKE
ncbi:efflux RND transporter periplasmic adaptor subunit [Salegentibacter sp. Hel_I_6]|uniref:efflux RND transporter periplasmic adaptor subunit n=1 Tax=Salegentibacter sp. Hel_I_6 TaxID=1250278 RepID=UPI00068D2D63|nr:efflux RND transporter periplasmic adaptor subunit [Salegentibacter sp. Hel_I_6]